VGGRKKVALLARLRRYNRCGAAPPRSDVRVIGSEKVWERGAALTSRSQTLEAELLAEEGYCVAGTSGPGIDRQSRSDRLAVPGRAGHRLDRDTGPGQKTNSL
jgi:hypothetical protein